MKPETKRYSTIPFAAAKHAHTDTLTKGVYCHRCSMPINSWKVSPTEIHSPLFPFFCHHHFHTMYERHVYFESVRWLNKNISILCNISCALSKSWLIILWGDFSNIPKMAPCNFDWTSGMAFRVLFVGLVALFIVLVVFLLSWFLVSVLFLCFPFIMMSTRSRQRSRRFSWISTNNSTRIVASVRFCSGLSSEACKSRRRL